MKQPTASPPSHGLGALARMRALSVLARLRDRVVGLVRGRPRIAERVLVLPRLVPSRSIRARLYRSFSWSLVDQLRPRVRISSRGGKMVVDTGDAIGRVLAASGEWEPNVTDVFRRRLGAGDVCIDVGAHVGYYTLLASKLVGPSGHVYAFEASQAVYRSLASNLTLNGVTNVTALNVAAGAEEGSAVLHHAPGPSPGTSSLSARVLESPHGGRPEEYVPVEVDVATVDSVVPAESFPRVRLIKVDVEGYEVEALRGLERIVAAGTPLSLLVEVSPDWSVEDPAAYLERLCAEQRLVPYRLVNEYSLEGYFPRRLQPPLRVERIPSERCDLLLARE